MGREAYFSLLVGQSLAAEYRYKPKSYLNLGDQLIHELGNGSLEISPVIEHVANAYEKLGFILHATREVDKLDHDLIIKYHLCNFIFYCKSFLDALSNAISSALNIQMKPVNIDLSKKKFVHEIALKMPKLEKQLRSFATWINYVTEFRMKLIHRQRIFFMHKEPMHPSKPEMPREPIHPLLFFDRSKLETFSKKLTSKYGSSFIPIDDFCHEQTEKAKGIFETVVLALKSKIEEESSDRFPWETVSPEHIGKPVYFS